MEKQISRRNFLEKIILSSAAIITGCAGASRLNNSQGYYTAYQILEDNVRYRLFRFRDMDWVEISTYKNGETARQAYERGAENLYFPEFPNSVTTFSQIIFISHKNMKIDNS